MDKVGLYNNIFVSNIKGDTDEEVLKDLSNIMLEKGYVKESYIDAICEREKKFPTGLVTSSVGIALPHTDYDHVKEPAIGVGLLEKAVKFKAMEDLEKTVDVEILFMLAIKEPDEQLQVLRKLVCLFQDEHTLNDIKSTEDEEEILNIVRNFLFS